MKSIVKALAAGTLIAALLICGAACSKKAEQPEETSDVEQYAPIPDSDVPTFSVETPYCTFNYPERWEDKVKVETTEENGNYTVSFSADFGKGREARVFDLIFGESDEYVLGHLVREDGNINVYLKTYDLEGEGYTDEEYKRYVMMAEDINVIMVNLVETENFVINY